MRVNKMEFYINPLSLQGVFTVPNSIADKHLKLSGAVQLKVLLYALRHMSENICDADISSALNIPLPDVNDALCFWADAQIIVLKGDPIPKPEVKETKPIRRTAVVKPTREDVIRRGKESDKIVFLLQEAQKKFGRLLKTNESSTLVWLLDDQGMDVSLILMLIEYAVSLDKCNISFIEKTAIEWKNSGVETISDAERHIAELYRKNTAWKIVRAVFGIDDRLASTKELDYAEKWINQWKVDKDLLRLAYEKCVDTKSKFIMSYTAKIIEEWHNMGFKTADDVKRTDKPDTAKKGYGSYDINLVEQMINKGYGEN